MQRTKDIIGKRFGRLTVIKQSGRTSSRQITYLCQCDCGKTTDKPTCANLMRGHTKSCGCFKRENVKLNQVTGEAHHQWKGCGEIPGSMFNNIRTRAKSKNIPINITIKDMHDQLVKQHGLCALTGEKLEFAKTQKDANLGKTTASLDRIDSSKGYELGNIQWLHKNVNWMKLDFTEKEFIEWCTKIADYNRYT